MQSSGASASGVISSGLPSSGTFKDFEKKTYDAWEIDEESSSSIMNKYGFGNLSNNEYAMPISLLVSFHLFNIAIHG